MMKRVMRGLIPTTLLAIGVTACGGPDIDKVKADFENPTGSAKDKNAVIAANGKQNTAGSNSALAFAGGGVPGISGQGLTLEGKGGAFTKLAPLNVFGRQMVNNVSVGLHRSELRVQEGAASCLTSSDVESANAELAAAIASGGDASASVSLSANLADCGAGATGTLDISMDMKVEGQVISYDVEMKFGNVCEDDTGNCVDGSMAQQATLDFGSAEGNLFGSIKSVSAWDLTATYVDEDGKKLEIKSKGGLRIGFTSDATGGSGKIEYLEYVNDESGEEVSYVLVIEADAAGTVMLTIRCSNNDELTCTFNDTTGAGVCMGNIGGETVNLEWSDAEYDAVIDSDEFQGG